MRVKCYPTSPGAAVQRTTAPGLTIAGTYSLATGATVPREGSGGWAWHRHAQPHLQVAPVEMGLWARDRSTQHGKAGPHAVSTEVGVASGDFQEEGTPFT